MLSSQSLRSFISVLAVCTTYLKSAWHMYTQLSTVVKGLHERGDYAISFGGSIVRALLMHGLSKDPPISLSGGSRPIYLGGQLAPSDM